MCLTETFDLSRSGEGVLPYIIIIALRVYSAYTHKSVNESVNHSIIYQVCDLSCGSNFIHVQSHERKTEATEASNSSRNY